MADVNVKNQSSNQPSKENTQENTASLQRQTGGGSLSRSRGTDPSGFWLSPAEFFTGNPFTLMWRMSEEMDRTFGQFFGRTSAGMRSWYPAVETTEREGQLHVHVVSVSANGAGGNTGGPLLNGSSDLPGSSNRAGRPPIRAAGGCGAPVR